MSLIAQNRFGLGASAKSPQHADPRASLLAQFDVFNPRPASVAAFPSSVENARVCVEASKIGAPDGTRLTIDQRRAKTREFRDYAARTLADGVRCRTEIAIASAAPFVERLVHFWANHFAISTDGTRVSALAANFEFDAIRPHVLGRFDQMLLATTRHPAMLAYLDQVTSMGPNSDLALQRNRYRRSTGAPDEFGANENFAREVLELHTLGVDGGYTQADIVEMAYALSGWSVGGFVFFPQSADARPGEFVFNPRWHEPGNRSVLGVSYTQRGEAKGVALLRDIARHPATARHISWKLARHFVADEPPQPLVDRMAKRFLETGGHLPDVYAELVQAPEAWAATSGKMRTPWDWMLAAFQALGIRSVDGIDTLGIMQALGQPVWSPGSPAGWPDVGSAWAGTNMMLARIRTAQQLAEQHGRTSDAKSMAIASLGEQLSAQTRTAITSNDGANAVALVLLSREFHRR